MLVFRLRHKSTGSIISVSSQKGDADLEAATRNVVLEAFERFIEKRPKIDNSSPEVLSEATEREIEQMSDMLQNMRNALIDALGGSLDREEAERLIDGADRLLNL